MPIRESSVRARFNLLAKGRGWLTCPAFVPSLGEGWPDRVLCVDGVFVGVELKRPGEKPTDIQLLRLRQIREAGGVGLWGDDAEAIVEEVEFLAGPTSSLYERAITEKVHV